MVYGLGLTGSILAGIAALAVLVYTAEVAVKKFVGIAEYYGIPDVVIALTVLSVGTSLPELASHIVASIGILRGTLSYEVGSSTVLGANIGSDVVQQTLLIGVVVFFMAYYKGKPFAFSHKFLRRDYLPMIGTTLMTLILAWDGVLSRIDGLVLLGSFSLYMYYIYSERGTRSHDGRHESTNPLRDVVIALIAMAAVLGSAHVMLEIVEFIVAETGLGGSLIGVVSLGVASALPELFTAVAGIRNEATSISLGTLIGSNITNPLLAIGAGSLLSTYWVPRPLVLWDLPMETITAAALLGYLLLASDRKLGKGGAIYLIGLYVFYVVIRYMYFAID